MSTLSEEVKSSQQKIEPSNSRDKSDREASLGAEQPPPTPPTNGRRQEEASSPAFADSSTKYPCGENSQPSDAMRDANGALKRKSQGPRESNNGYPAPATPRKRGRDMIIGKNGAGNDDATGAGSTAPAPAPMPILCTHLSRDVFGVIRVRGKSLACGGFGFVTVGRRSSCSRAEEDSPERQAAPSNATSTAAAAERDHTDDGLALNGKRSVAQSGAVIATEHLFLEEVLFLHERGLLECRDVRDADERSTAATTTTNPDLAPYRTTSASLVWDAFCLYSLLNRDDTVSLPVYLVYAHLRKQGFRVVRHTPHRRALLEEDDDEEEEKQPTTDPGFDGRESRRSDQRRQRQLLLREDAAHAAPPTLFSLAWDVYQPSKQFRRARPGLPDFYAAVATYNAPMPMQRIVELVDECRGIPFQIGTVSSSGQVVMMGIHDFAAPRIVRHVAGGTTAGNGDT